MTTTIKDGQHSAVKGLALVADDDPTMRAIMTAFLIKAGYKVLQAASGREAVSVAKDLDFSIAFIDLAMPNGNGLQTCAALRSAPRWRDVPIIVLTAYTREMAMKAAIDAGASGFLSKPVDQSELQWCVDTYEKIAPRAVGVALDSPSVADRDSRFATDVLDIPEESLPPFDSHWTLMYSSPHLSCSRTSDSVNETAVRPAETKMDDLNRVARFFPHDMMAGFLHRISVSVDEILLLIEGREIASDGSALGILLHNISGTAGTLGLTTLSTAACNLLNDHSGSSHATKDFVDTANRALDAIVAYTGGLHPNSHSAPNGA